MSYSAKCLVDIVIIIEDREHGIFNAFIFFFFISLVTTLHDKLLWVLKILYYLYFKYCKYFLRVNDDKTFLNKKQRAS